MNIKTRSIKQVNEATEYEGGSTRIRDGGEVIEKKLVRREN